MTNSAIQVTGLVLCLLASICTIVTFMYPGWRQNDLKGEIIEAVIKNQGIWIRCVSYATGLWQCDDYDSLFLGLPIELQVSRSLSILSVFAMFFAILLSIVGMECTKCLEDAGRIKSRIALAASCLWIVSALTIGIAVSYYANLVAQEYNFLSALGGNSAFSDQGVRYVFGPCLFLGWAAMGIGVLGGCIMLCGSCYVESEDDEYWNKGPVGRGVRRMRNSFRESYRTVRPHKSTTREVDYV